MRQAPALFALALCACGSADPTVTPLASPTASGVPPGEGQIDARCYGQPPVALLGVGSLAYTPADDGVAVEMVHGAQGGWHIDTALWLRNLRSIVGLHVQLYLNDPWHLIAEERLEVLTLPAGLCEATYPGIYAWLDVSALAQGDLDTPPELLSFQSATLVGWVQDSDGSAAEDQLQVVLVPEPADVSTPAP